MFEKNFFNEISWISRIHPTPRIVCTLIFTLCIALSFKLTTLSIALIVSILVLLLSKINLKLIFKKLTLLLSFILILWLGLSFTSNSDTLTNIRFLEFKNLLVLQIAVRSISISLFFICFIATMNPAVLAYGLNNIYIPKKMIYLILITYRYIFILELEYRRLVCAIKLRNFSFKTNMHTYKTYSYLIGMLFVRAYDRATRVNNAMLCRNFNGKFFLTKKYYFNWQTFIFIFSSVLLTMILIIIETKL